MLQFQPKIGVEMFSRLLMLYVDLNEAHNTDVSADINEFVELGMWHRWSDHDHYWGIN